MVTRFYLEADATTAPFPSFANPTITPSYDAAWGVTGGASRRWMTTTKMLTPLAATAAVTETSTTSGIDVLARQFISTALTAQTIDGNVKGQIRVHESIDTADMQAQVVIRVCSNDGTTILATLLAADASGLGASEFAITTGTNRKFPLASVSPATLTSYACAAGDRLLVEIGYQAFNTTATSRNSIFRFGSNAASDLAENETATTEDNPWIEFSDTITFAEPERRASQEAVLVAGSDTSERRASQVPLLVAGSDTSERRVSQIPLLVLGSPPATGASKDRGRGRETSDATVLAAPVTGASTDRGRERSAALTAVVTSGAGTDRGRARSTAVADAFQPLIEAASVGRSWSRSTAAASAVAQAAGNDRGRARAQTSAQAVTTAGGSDRGRGRGTATGDVPTVEAAGTGRAWSTTDTVVSAFTHTGTGSTRSRAWAQVAAQVITTAAGGSRTQGRHSAAAGTFVIQTSDGATARGRGRYTTTTTVILQQGRLTAVGAEVLEADTPTAWLTALGTESLQTQTPDGRLTAIGAEALVALAASVDGQITQIGAEVLQVLSTSPDGRVTVIGVEVLQVESTVARLTTIGAEVLIFRDVPGDGVTEGIDQLYSWSS